MIAPLYQAEKGDVRKNEGRFIKWKHKILIHQNYKLLNISCSPVFLDFGLKPESKTLSPGLKSDTAPKKGSVKTLRPRLFSAKKMPHGHKAKKNFVKIPFNQKVPNDRKTPKENKYFTSYSTIA